MTAAEAQRTYREYIELGIGSLTFAQWLAKHRTLEFACEHNSFAVNVRTLSDELGV